MEEVEQQRLFQETLELQELQASIARTHSLAERASAIVEGFDLRLVRLETAILPIHGSTQKLSRVIGYSS